MTTKKLLIVIISTIVLGGNSTPCTAMAQGSPADIRMRLAQSYERSGDFESALRVYSELFSTDSSNFMLIESLKRCHLKLKHNDEVIALIEYGLKLNPADIGSRAQLGNVYLLKGDEEKAAEVWAHAISLAPGEETAYRVVGSSMIQARQFERAAAIYRDARKALGNPTLFASDIAYLYGIMQKYPESTREYLALLRQTPSQLIYIQSRISSFTGNDRALAGATAVVEEAVAAERKNVEFRRLLAWLFMEGKNFDAAYGVYRELDTLTGGGGKELFTFAGRAFNEKSYAAASKALSEVIDRNPNFREMPRARYSLARSLEELESAGRIKTEPGAGVFDRAIGMYNRIVFDYPNTEIAGQSLLRIALIRKDKLSDPGGARDVLEKIASDYKIFLPVATEARLALGEIYIGFDDLDRAAGTLTAVAGTPPYGGPDRELAALRLAELSFYRHHYPQAMTILSDLTRNSVSDVTNDAISLQLLITENEKDNREALDRYAEARLLRAGRRDADALAILDDELTSRPGNALADRIAFMKGEILVLMKKPDEALASFALIVDSYPESLLRDRAMFNTASIYETDKADRAGAIRTYELLLEKYPNSIHAGAARKRIRFLRGDNI
ncbi:MAG TPA: tetratricopeptide repeat protein [Bacteroidota bacterium]|nr:tetratricopeptide repeat protein [Bacteroidota bacterium]